MKKKKICWLTADYFIDCDAFVVPMLLNEYDISWYILEGKTSTNGNKNLKESLIKCCSNVTTTYIFKHRLRDPRIIFEYLSLLHTIKNKSPDIIYIAFNGLPYFMPLIWILFNKRKIIYASHNTTTPKGAINAKYANIYQNIVLMAFSKFHVFSINQKNALEQRYKNKEIYYASLTLKNYGLSQKTPDPNVISFLFFGIIREYKRVDLLIKAACNVYEKINVPFKIQIAGNCDNWQKYQQMIRYPEIFIINSTTIPDNQIADLFCSNHYFVQPYQDGTQSGTLKIAFNYNIPIIASDIDAFKEFIEDRRTGYLFNSENVHSLEDTLIEILINHRERYKQMKQKQLEYIKRECSTDSIINKYKEFLNIA